MKKFIISLLIVAAFVAIPVSVFAQNTDNANAAGKVLILTPISIVKSMDLEFGAIAQSGAGTVTIAPDNTANAADVTGDVALAAVDGRTTRTHASFAVKGDASNSFSIVYDETTLTLATGLTIDLTGKGESSALLSEAALDVSGDYVLNIGGVLTVPENSVAGDYTKTFNVTVAYN